MFRLISSLKALAKLSFLNRAFRECKDTTFSQDAKGFCDKIPLYEEL